MNILPPIVLLYDSGDPGFAYRLRERLGSPVAVIEDVRGVAKDAANIVMIPTDETEDLLYGYDPKWLGRALRTYKEEWIGDTPVIYTGCEPRDDYDLLLFDAPRENVLAICFGAMTAIYTMTIPFLAVPLPLDASDDDRIAYIEHEITHKGTPNDQSAPSHRLDDADVC